MGMYFKKSIGSDKKGGVDGYLELLNLTKANENLKNENMKLSKMLNEQENKY
jgi:hypothetical protein